MHIMDSNLLSTKNGLFSFSDYSVDDLCDLGQSEPENLAVASCLLYILLKQLNSVSSVVFSFFFFFFGISVVFAFETENIFQRENHLRKTS